MEGKVNIINISDIEENDFKLNAESYLDSDRFEVVKNRGLNYIKDTHNGNEIISMVGGFEKLCDLCDILNSSWSTIDSQYNHINELMKLHFEITDMFKEREQLLYNLLCEISQSIQYGIDNERSYGDEYTTEVLNDIYNEFNLKDFQKKVI